MKEKKLIFRVPARRRRSQGRPATAGTPTGVLLLPSEKRTERRERIEKRNGKKRKESLFI